MLKGLKYINIDTNTLADAVSFLNKMPPDAPFTKYNAYGPLTVAIIVKKI